MKKNYITKFINDIPNINVENNYLIICLSLESYNFYKTIYKNTKHIDEFVNITHLKIRMLS